MSTRVMAKCWPLQMDGVPKAVLISLADQANDEGVCWPSIGSIATRTCFSERTIVRAIGHLQTIGAVHLERVAGKSTTYVVTPDRVTGVTESHPLAQVDPDLAEMEGANLSTAPATVAPLTQSHPCQSVRRGVTQSHPGGDRESPPYIEPSLNRKRSVNARDVFSKVWDAYPLKRSRGRAEKAWTKLQPSELLVTAILAGIEKAKTSAAWRKDQGAFIPLLATWLADRGWEDDHSPPRLLLSHTRAQPVEVIAPLTPERREQGSAAAKAARAALKGTA